MSVLDREASFHPNARRKPVRRGHQEFYLGHLSLIFPSKGSASQTACKLPNITSCNTAKATTGRIPVDAADGASTLKARKLPAALAYVQVRAVPMASAFENPNDEFLQKVFDTIPTMLMVVDKATQI